ncbi:hypothetical protein OCA24_29180 [Bacillus cereus]|nr:hypothetical protein [Bacillus cereus]
MNFQMKTETGKEVSFKINTAVALSLISTIATGIGTLAFKLFM